MSTLTASTWNVDARGCWTLAEDQRWQIVVPRHGLRVFVVARDGVAVAAFEKLCDALDQVAKMRGAMS